MSAGDCVACAAVRSILEEPAVADKALGTAFLVGFLECLRVSAETPSDARMPLCHGHASAAKVIARTMVERDERDETPPATALRVIKGGAS